VKFSSGRGEESSLFSQFFHKRFGVESKKASEISFSPQVRWRPPSIPPLTELDSLLLPRRGKKTQDSALPEVPQELPLVLPSCSATALHWMRLTNLTKHYTPNILTRCFRLCCCIKKFIFVKKKKFTVQHICTVCPRHVLQKGLLKG